MKFFGKEYEFFREKASAIVDVANKKPTPEEKIISVIKFPQQLMRLNGQDIAKYRTATRVAESVLNPTRRLLYQIYKDVRLDGHLTGVIQARKNKTLSKEFLVVNANGETDEEKTKLFQAKWFRDYLDLVLETPYWGHTLIQFSGIEDDKFYGVELVPREYVRPEFDVVTEIMASNFGVNFLEQPFSNWCIPVGGKRDLGLLLMCTPQALWKKNAIGAWSEYAEIFGSPMRILKTNVRDARTRQNGIDMMVNAGTAPYMVIDTDDKIEFAQVTRTDAYHIYQELINLNNSEMSKIILGQTGTTDEKSFTGSANVHEAVSEEFALADETLVISNVQDKLFPLMNFHGFGLEGFFAKFNDSDKLDSMDKIKIDTELMKGQFRPTKEYIEKTYGTEGEYHDPVPAPGFGKPIADKLKNLYK